MRALSRRPPAPRNKGTGFPGVYALAGALLAAGSLLLASPWLLGRVTIPYDAKAHFYPQFVFLARSLHAGQSPFWTPNVFDGSPQIADPQSLIFSPAFLSAALLGPAPSFALADAVVFASLAAGGGALLLFFRDRGWHPAGALVAALAFAFGGSAAWRVQHVGEVLSLAWLPFALLALSRALDRRSMVWGAAAGLFGALVLLGRDQVALLECFMLAAYTIAGALRRPPREWLRPLAPAFCVGTAVAIVPVALTVAFVAQSNRPAIDFAEAVKGSLHPGSLLTLLSADLFAVSGPLAQFWGPPSVAWGETNLFLARNMGTLYLGALPVVAVAALAVVRPRDFWTDRDARFLVLAAVLLLLFALGKHTPAFMLLYRLPGVDLFRRPADATFPLCACLAMLGGYAVHRLAHERVAFPTLAAIVALALAACLAAAAGKDRLAQAFPAILVASACLTASAATIPVLRRSPPAAAAVLVGVLLTADLAANNGPNESTGLPPSEFDMLRPGTRDTTLAVLRERLNASAAPDRRDRIELAGLGFSWPNASLVHDVDHDLGYNPIRSALFEAFAGAGDHLALPEQRVFSRAFPSYRSPAADLTGLRLVATGVPIDRIDPAIRPGDLRFVARTQDAFIYENPRALPRVLLATRAVNVDEARLLREGNWPDVDYRTTVLLSAPQGAEVVRRPGTARLARYGNTDVVVEADAPDGGWLVLNDVWHPWWSATVDGAPADLLRANGVFRAVALPPGHHDVRFSFRPLAGLWAQLRNMFRPPSR